MSKRGLDFTQPVSCSVCGHSAMSCCCPADSPPPKRKPDQSDDPVTKQPQSKHGSRSPEGKDRNGVDRDRRDRDRDRKDHRDLERDHKDRERDRSRGDRDRDRDQRNHDRPISASHVRVEEKSRSSSGSKGDDLDPAMAAELGKLLERLESVTTRLEAAASKGGGAGGAGGGASQSGRLPQDVSDAIMLCDAARERLEAGIRGGGGRGSRGSKGQSNHIAERFARRLHDVRGRLAALEKRLGQRSSHHGGGGSAGSPVSGMYE